VTEVAASLSAMLLPTLILGMLVVFRPNTKISLAVRRLDEPRRLALLAGALLVTGCFFAGQSAGYRGIFLLLVLPGLFALGRDKAGDPVALAARLTAVSIPPLMWADAMRFWIYAATTGEYSIPEIVSVPVAPLQIAVWLVRELLWSFVIAFLVTIVAGFVFDRIRQTSNPESSHWTERREMAIT
jgi:hypothetical protein